MVDLVRPAMGNRLLTLMSAPDFDRIRPHLEAIYLPQRMQLVQPDQPVSHVYFPNTGIGSIVAFSPGGMAHSGMVGSDGMCPTGVVLEPRSSPLSIFMQVAGEGFRIEYDAFMDVLRNSPEFRSLLLRYVHTLLTQVSYNALSNSVEHVEERLARLILMCHDRSEHDEIPLTHGAMAGMLAVRRPGVTTALHVLEGRSMVLSRRGVIIVRDRQALESSAGGSYGKPELEYSRLIGPMTGVK